MNKPTGDKRTLKYKEELAKWEALQDIEIVYQEPDGLGDFVEAIIPKAVKKAIGKDCGCDGRKDALNKFSKDFLSLFTTRRHPKRCMTDEMYVEYGNYMKVRGLNRWEDKEINMLVRICNHVFDTKYKSSGLCRNCGGSAKLLFRITSELDIMHNSYGE